MMRTASEKLATICLVEESELSVRRTLDEIKISRTSFYRGTVPTSKTGWMALRIRAEPRGVTGTGHPTRFSA